jgi:2-keto-3-deoxy-L-rhamnonate aldolase RhmA
MSAQIGENRAKKMLKANELVLCMAVNQLRTPNIAMIAAACGFDAVYIDLEHNPTSLETSAGVCVAASSGSRRLPESPHMIRTTRPGFSIAARKA